MASVRKLPYFLLAYAASAWTASADPTNPLTDTSTQDTGILGGSKGGITQDKIRNGDFSFGDIPNVILNMTNFFLAFAGTISVIMIIYGAFRLSTGSLESDKDTAKKIITASIIGFALAVSAWAIIKIVMTNL